MSPAEPERSYSISEAADILCISVPTLRMYEREGLVIPSRRDSGHRAYTEDQLERIRCYRQTMVRDKITIAHFKRLLSLIPCWEVNHCPESVRANCHAYPRRDMPCWEVTEKPWQELCGKCLECEVYKRSQDTGELVRMIAEYTAYGEAEQNKE
jgi:MerR family transcriptional regulator, heat shock protein HspR